MKNKVQNNRKKPQQKKKVLMTEKEVRNKRNPYPVIGDYPSVNKYCNRGD